MIWCDVKNMSWSSGKYDSASSYLKDFSKQTKQFYTEMEWLAYDITKHSNAISSWYREFIEWYDQELTEEERQYLNGKYADGLMDWLFWSKYSWEVVKQKDVLFFNTIWYKLWKAFNNLKSDWNPIYTSDREYNLQTMFIKSIVNYATALRQNKLGKFWTLRLLHSLWFFNHPVRVFDLLVDFNPEATTALLSWYSPKWFVNYNWITYWWATMDRKDIRFLFKRLSNIRRYDTYFNKAVRRMVRSFKNSAIGIKFYWEEWRTQANIDKEMFEYRVDMEDLNLTNTENFYKAWVDASIKLQWYSSLASMWYDTLNVIKWIYDRPAKTLDGILKLTFKTFWMIPYIWQYIERWFRKFYPWSDNFIKTVNQLWWLWFFFWIWPILWSTALFWFIIWWLPSSYIRRISNQKYWKLDKDEALLIRTVRNMEKQNVFWSYNTLWGNNWMWNLLSQMSLVEDQNNIEPPSFLTEIKAMTWLLSKDELKAYQVSKKIWWDSWTQSLKDTFDELPDTLKSWLQNWFVDSTQVPYYTELAWWITLRKFNIKSVKDYEDAIKNWDGGMIYASVKEWIDYFFVRNHENGNAQYLWILYDFWTYFWHRWLWVAKQTIKMFGWDVIRKIGRDRLNWTPVTTAKVMKELSEDYNVRMLFINAIRIALFSMKMERYMEDDPSDIQNKSPMSYYFSQKWEFIKSFFGKLSYNIIWLLSSPLWRTAILPIMNFLKLPDWATPQEYMKLLANQMISEAQRSKPVVNIMDKTVVQYNIWNYNMSEDDWISDLALVVWQSLMQSWAKVIAQDFDYWINQDWYIPIIFEPNKDLKFLFWESTNVVANESRLIQILNSFSNWIKYDNEDKENPKIEWDNIIKDIPWGDTMLQFLFETWLRWSPEDIKLLANEELKDTLYSHANAHFVNNWWHDASVDFTKQSDEVNSFLIRKTLAWAFKVFNWDDNVWWDGISNSAYQWTIDKGGKIFEFDIEGKYVNSSYYSVFLDKLDTKEKDFYIYYSNTLTNLMKDKEGNKKAIASLNVEMLDAMSKVSPKAKLAIMMYADIEQQIKDNGINTFKAFTKENWMTESLAKEIKANTLNKFKNEIMFVDKLTWMQAHNLSNPDLQEVMFKWKKFDIIDKNWKFDYQSIWVLSISLSQKAWQDMLYNMELAKNNPSAEKVKNYFSSYVYNLWELYNKRWLSTEVAYAKAYADYAELVQQWYNNEQDLVNLLVAPLVWWADAKTMVNVFTSDTIKDILGTGKFNAVHNMLYGIYESWDAIGKAIENNDLSAFDVAYDPLWYKDNKNNSNSFYNKNYKSAYYTNQNQINKFLNAYARIVPYYFREVKWLPSYAPKFNYYDKNTYAYNKAQNNYQKTAYIPFFKLEKAWWNLISRQSSGGKWFGTKLPRTKSAKTVRKWKLPIWAALLASSNRKRKPVKQNSVSNKGDKWGN